jgi:hypothetical protein
MRRFFLTLFLASYSLLSYSQNYQVKGSVLDTAGVPLTGTLIKLKNGKDSIQTSADIDGNFNLQM